MQMTQSTVAHQERFFQSSTRIALIVGIVVGAGIFKTPSIVAANAGSEALFVLIWPLGGAISLIGAASRLRLFGADGLSRAEYVSLTPRQRELME